MILIFQVLAALYIVWSLVVSHKGQQHNHIRHLGMLIATVPALGVALGALWWVPMDIQTSADPVALASRFLSFVSGVLGVYSAVILLKLYQRSRPRRDKLGGVDAMIRMWETRRTIIDKHLQDLSKPENLRALERLHLQDARFDGLPLAQIIVERLHAAPIPVISMAMQHGFGRDEPELKARIEQHQRAQHQGQWETLLEAEDKARRLGQGMRRLLEEALARQEPRVAVAWGGHSPQNSALKQLRSHIQGALGRHLRQHHLELVDAQHHPDPTFTLQIDIDHQNTRRLTEPRFVKGRVATTRAVEYPVMGLRVRLLRRQHLEAEVRLDNKGGLSKIDTLSRITQDHTIKVACRELTQPLMRALGWTTTTHSKAPKRTAAAQPIKAG